MEKKSHSFVIRGLGLKIQMTSSTISDKVTQNDLYFVPDIYVTQVVKYTQ